jgi:hypothetical protein
MSDSAPKPARVSLPPQAAERRAWVRYPSRRLQLLWHLFGVKPPEQRPAKIQDISLQGVGLVVDRSFPQGSVLVLRLPGSLLESRSVLVRVKHLEPLADGQFQVGCTFVVPLTDTQLAELI